MKILNLPHPEIPDAPAPDDLRGAGNPKSFENNPYRQKTSSAEKCSEPIVAVESEPGFISGSAGVPDNPYSSRINSAEGKDGQIISQYTQAALVKRPGRTRSLAFDEETSSSEVLRSDGVLQSAGRGLSGKVNRVMPMRKRLRLLTRTSLTVALVLAAAGIVAGVLSVIHSAEMPAKFAREHPRDNKPETSANEIKGAPVDTGTIQPKDLQQEIIVQVVGAVRNPGVVKVQTGGRVNDALEKAGGALETADLRSLNLARPVVDGEQIDVLTVEESTRLGSAGSKADGKVSLNKATAEDLEKVEGIGPVTAKKIIDWRTAHGAFTSLKQLSEISGIGEKTIARLKEKLTL